MIASWPINGAGDHAGERVERGLLRGIARTPAFSQEGAWVTQTLSDVEASRFETRYQGGRLEQLLIQLHSLTRDPDVGPIDISSFAVAEMLLRSLAPQDLPDEVDVDPDGEATFDWGQQGNRFAISVNSRWQIAYAGLFAGETTKGKEPFSGDQVPLTILDGISRCRK